MEAAENESSGGNKTLDVSSPEAAENESSGGNKILDVFSPRSAVQGILDIQTLSRPSNTIFLFRGLLINYFTQRRGMACKWQ
jgi:hypothetical protein